MSAIQIFPNPNLVRLEKPLPFSTNRSDDPKSLLSRIQHRDVKRCVRRSSARARIETRWNISRSVFLFDHGLWSSAPNR
ncbi:hypothetical protein NPIL_514341 [Nephila pilipes]|uniref:Uncharacterized protein n=1 Tax=Nephila pilipes TaxID=299642 RepID=A0A8X6QJC7_NEPPI|nr:hypothetical protein NPIL_514341 [Nephila pilipes]